MLGDVTSRYAKSGAANRDHAIGHNLSFEIPAQYQARLQAVESSTHTDEIGG